MADVSTDSIQTTDTSACATSSVGIGFVLLGMGCAILASLGSTFGLILQKLAQMRNDALPENEKFPTSGAIIWSPTWILGLVLLILIPFPLDLVAFSLAPQSLVVPLTGVTLILNQVIAPSVLKEKVSCLDWIATGVITCGIVLSTAFGSHCSLAYTVDEIMDFFGKTPFQVAEAFFVVSMIACWWFLNWGAYMCFKCEHKIDRCRSVVFGYVAGAVGGQQQIFLKATGELFESTFNGNPEWDRWEASVFSTTCVVLAVAQIQFLNKGMALWTAIKYLPIYNVCLILCSTTYGGIFYEEYKELSTVGIVFFPFGVGVVTVGAVLLGCKNDTGQASASVEPCPESSPGAVKHVKWRDASGTELVEVKPDDSPKSTLRMQTHNLANSGEFVHKRDTLARLMSHDQYDRLRQFADQQKPRRNNILAPLQAPPPLGDTFAFPMGLDGRASDSMPGTPNLNLPGGLFDQRPHQHDVAFLLDRSSTRSPELVQSKAQAKAVAVSHRWAEPSNVTHLPARPRKILTPTLAQPPNESLAELQAAATKIQAVTRGNSARVLQQDQQQAALKVQAVQRGKIARQEQKQRGESAARIQAIHRARTGRRIASSLRDEGVQAQTDSALGTQVAQRGRTHEQELRQESAMPVQGMSPTVPTTPPRMRDAGALPEHVATGAMRPTVPTTPSTASVEPTPVEDVMPVQGMPPTAPSTSPTVHVERGDSNMGPVEVAACGMPVQDMPTTAPTTPVGIAEPEVPPEHVATVPEVFEFESSDEEDSAKKAALERSARRAQKAARKADEIAKTAALEAQQVNAAEEKATREHARQEEILAQEAAASRIQSIQRGISARDEARQRQIEMAARRKAEQEVEDAFKQLAQRHKADEARESERQTALEAATRATERASGEAETTAAHFLLETSLDSSGDTPLSPTSARDLASRSSKEASDIAELGARTPGEAPSTARLHSEHEAAAHIQAVQRGNAARGEVSKVRAEAAAAEKQAEAEEGAAARIQAVQRGNAARGEVSKVRAKAAAAGEQAEAEEGAAARIQAVQRGNAARVDVSKVREEAAAAEVTARSKEPATSDAEAAQPTEHAEVSTEHAEATSDALIATQAREVLHEHVEVEEGVGGIASQSPVDSEQVSNSTMGSVEARIFGGDLDMDERGIFIVKAGLKCLDASHLTVEGLWRKTGSKRKTAELIAETERLGELPIKSINDCHCLTSLLVQLLRKVPGGLIHASLVLTLLDLYDSGSATSDYYMEALRKAMSRNKRHLLIQLILHWQRVVEADNRMDEHAVVTCTFGAVAPEIASYSSRLNDVMVVMRAIYFGQPEVRAKASNESKLESGLLNQLPRRVGPPRLPPFLASQSEESVAAIPTCPVCSTSLAFEELNCDIIRCGYDSEWTQFPPHACKKATRVLLKTSQAGCGTPLKYDTTTEQAQWQQIPFEDDPACEKLHISWSETLTESSSF